MTPIVEVYHQILYYRIIPTTNYLLLAFIESIIVLILGFVIFAKIIINGRNINALKLKHCPVRYFGGLEMVMAIGAMLQAAELGIVIMVDGFIMTNCILAASKLYPEVLHYAIFGHCGDETGHKLLLDHMEARPLLNLGLRLGEGTGAICAYPIVQSAVRMINEMDNFAHASITKYF